MAEFEIGPRVLHPQEENRLRQIFRTHVIDPGGIFDHRIGGFPMIDRWGVMSGDLNFDRLTLFNRILLGKDPEEWKMQQHKLLWVQSRTRKSIREKLELKDMRLIDNLSSILVDTTPSGLVRLRPTDSKTGRHSRKFI